MCAVTCAYVHMRNCPPCEGDVHIYIQHHPSNIVTVMLHPTPAPHKPQSQRTQSYLSSVCFFLWFAVMVCCYGLLLFCPKLRAAKDLPRTARLQTKAPQTNATGRSSSQKAFLHAPSVAMLTCPDLSGFAPFLLGAASIYTQAITSPTMKEITCR